MEQKLFDASLAGKVDDFKRILRNNLDLVNWRNEKFSGWSPLHQACSNKHSAIVSLLLAHPDVDVNLKDNFGDVPFAYAQDGAVLRLLLADTRVKINEPNTGGETALSQASKKGNLEAVKWIIASGRQLDGTATDALNAAQNPVRQEYEIEDQVFVARKEQCSLVERLLIKYADSPETTTKEVRAELGLKGQEPPHLPTHPETAHFNSSTLFFLSFRFCGGHPGFDDQRRVHHFPWRTTWSSRASPFASDYLPARLSRQTCHKDSCSLCTRDSTSPGVDRAFPGVHCQEPGCSRGVCSQEAPLCRA